jgi:hypothetical protein
VLCELALRLGANPERWRIRSEAVREETLDLLQLSKKPVVLRVRNRRTIEDVVLVGRARENSAQLGGAAMLLLAGFRPWLLVAAGILGRLLLLL